MFHVSLYVTHITCATVTSLHLLISPYTYLTVSQPPCT